MPSFFKGWLYRLWAFGGLLVVVGVVVAAGLNWKPGDPPPYPAIGAAVGIYLVGLLTLQAVGISRTRPETDAGARPAMPIDPAHPPTTPEGLAEVLALPDADGTRSDRRSDAERDAHRFAWAQWLPIAAITILLPLGGFLWVTGAVPGTWEPLGPTGPGIPIAAIPGLVIVLILVFMLPRTMGRARQIGDDYHAPLGLSISHTPTSILLPRVGTDGVSHNLIGPTTFSGRRYGREVIVDAYSGSSAVLVEFSSPQYELDGRHGRLELESGDVPPGVQQFMTALQTDRRLNAVTVSAGPQGIRVDRRGASVNQGWLLDIWLAERLCDATGIG